MEMMLERAPASGARNNMADGGWRSIAGAAAPSDAVTLEAAHLDAAAELLQRHGMSLADCRVSRELAGFHGENGAVLIVVQVGKGVDVFALNEALTAVQYARGLTPSARLDVVFER